MINNIYKKSFSLFTALCCTIALAACTQTPPQSDTQGSSAPLIEEIAPSTQNLRIALTEADGVNPYVSNTNITHQASGLVFTNLVEISPTMEALPKALREVLVNELTVTLTPSPSSYFADGTAISSADIAACVNAARQSEAFSGQLSNIQAVEDNGSQVVLTLIEPDSLFAYLLTIPAIKASEVFSKFPTSSGLYSATASALTLNRAQNGLPLQIDTVSLTGFDEIVSALGVNEISLYYTEAENSSASGTTSLQTFYKLNNLVFLGINAQRGENTLFANADGRRAVSQMLDRQVIADKCYYQRAYPALGALNSFYPQVATKQLISANFQTDAAAQAMLSLGYKKNSIDGYYEKQAARCEVTLLVYSSSTYKRYAANLIKDTLSQNGIYVNIEETDNFEHYKQKIANGEFDMYIGEVKLYNNMDLSMLLNANDKSAYFQLSEELIAAYTTMRQSTNSYVEFEAAFERQMPYIPLVWRMGTLVTSKSVQGITPTLSNIFYDMNSISIS